MGDSMNIAARLGEIAEAGKICLSEQAYEVSNALSAKPVSLI
jgi:class 3 adenylate cyclase